MKKHRSDSPWAVRLAQIPPEGLRRTYDLSGTWAENALGATEAVPTSAHAAVDIELTRTAHDVYARGKVRGHVTMPCSRCAAEARVPLDGSFVVNFVPEGSIEETAAEAELELGAEELDVLEYQGDEIDLEETFREELLLALPMTPVCKEACQGLCARCGKDLNEGPCGCAKTEEAPRETPFAALKDLKL